MRIPRIHFPAELDSGAVIELDETASAHVLRVLRLRTGAPISIFNGRGGEYDGIIEAAERGRARVRLGRFNDRDTESPLRVTLAQGISRGERMDYTLQKAVELGVARIVPLTTKRCQVRLDEERRHRRLRHWEGVLSSACEQSGRTRIPELGPVSSLTQWLADSDDAARPAGQATLRLVLDHRGERGLGHLDVETKQVVLLVGPEGGLSEDEHGAARDAGYLGVRLGPRILRTETAGIAALATLQLLWGDLG